MSRKYVNDKWCACCTKTYATPYLVKKLDVISPSKDSREAQIVVDIGCGNGRNSAYMKEQGFEHIYSYDMVGDTGEEFVLGHDSFPLPMSAADIVLANYIFMFLDVWENMKIMQEVDRIVKPDGYFMVELYGAEDSFYSTEEKIADLQKEIIDFMEKRGWEKVHSIKEKFIMRKI